MESTGGTNHESDSATTPDWKNLTVTKLESLINSRDGTSFLINLRGQDAKVVVDLLDEVSRTISLSFTAQPRVGTWRAWTQDSPRKELQLRVAEALQCMRYSSYIAQNHGWN